MSQRNAAGNRISAKPSGVRSQAAGAAATVRPAAAPRTSVTTATSRSIIEAHRSVASVGLVLLIILALFAPLSHSAPDPALFITPQIDGSGSVVPDATSADLESTLFTYQTFIERSTGNLQSSWPDLSQVLESSGSSLQTKLALAGEVFASSSGGVGSRVKDTGLAAAPSQAVLDGISVTYADMCQTNPGQCSNGLALVNLLRSVTAPTQEDKADFERQAISGFQDAAGTDVNIWQYTYNWGLANLALGNYLSAFEAMRSIAGLQATQPFVLIKVWMGIAALRMGETNDAVGLFNEVIGTPLPSGATAGSTASYTQALALAHEALGDAEWARGDTSTAYKTYLDLIMSGNGSYGLYRKWLRLGLEQKAYEQMLTDMSAAADSGIAQDLKGRILHDRARMLSLLGRGSEALVDYKAALDLGQEDAPLLTSYAQYLLANGDATGAVAQAESALRKLNKDLSAGDMAGVASGVLTSTTTLFDTSTAQETLDAHIVRAMGWVKQGTAGLVDTLVANVTAGADGKSADVGGLLYLYGGYLYEAAGHVATGDQATDLNGKAADNYGKAWAKLKDLAPGQPGRSASLAGQARTTSLSKGKAASDGIAVLAAAGYDPVAIKTSVSSDPDASDILDQGALLLQKNGQTKEAANAYRVSSVVRNVLDAENFVGVGRAAWVNNGTPLPASLALRTGDAIRQTSGADLSQAIYRYKQAYQLDPALAPAWNNLGVLYGQMGNPASTAYLKNANAASPTYVLGNHNLAIAAYQSGLGNFFTAEDAQAAAIKSNGAESLRWGYTLSYDDRGPLPSPTGPPADFLLRVGALAILLLLLLHTLVGNDRMTNRMGLVPTKGLIGGRLAGIIDGQVKNIMPRLVQPQSGNRGLLLAVGIPAIVGMVALAWSAGRGSLGVALVFLPVAFVLALLAFGANELGQRWAAKRAGAMTMHHPWPTGILLGIVSIPFGFMYGWQNVTRLTTDDARQTGDGTIKKARTSEEIDLLYESQAEAAADTGGQSVALATPAGGVGTNKSGLFKLSPSARIMFAGMVANLALGVIFALIYWYTGWPSMRLGLYATTLVLAFTAVSEPPADGWTLYRRNAPLWLGIFLLAATTATLLAVGLI